MLRKGFTRQVEKHLMVAKTGLVRQIRYLKAFVEQTMRVYGKKSLTTKVKILMLEFGF